MDKKNLTIDNSILNETEGIISGYASVFNMVDQHSDLIQKGAFNGLNKQKVKLLWQHKTEEPIGVIEEIYEDEYGLYFRARLLLELPQAKEAYELLKAKAISGVSIGFKVQNYDYQGDVRVIKNIDLWEISLVTFPANQKANIIEVKQQFRGKNMKSTEDQQNALHNLRSVNETVLKSIEAKGSYDPLLKDQLDRINNHLDEYKSRIENVEVAMDRPFSGKSEYISNKDFEHKAAFNGYLRSGNEQNLSKLEQKALSSGSDPDGGYLISRQIANNMNKILQEVSPMRKLAAVEQISTSSLDIIEDYENAQAGWVAETAARDETDTPKISKRNIPVFEVYAQPSATQKLIDDSAIDIEKWLAEKLVDSFGKLESYAFIHGDGSTCPRGILTYKDGRDWGAIEQVSSNVENSFDYESIFKLYYSLKSDYARNASFLMNRSSIHMARTLKDKSTGRYLWNPSLDIAAPDTLIGVPVFETGDMPEVKKDALSIALADFKLAYKIVDRAGIRVLRDPYTFKPFVKFYTTKRVGGDVLNFEAIKLMKIS